MYCLTLITLYLFMNLKEAILTQQAKQERLNPVLPKLKTILEGLSK